MGATYMEYLMAKEYVFVTMCHWTMSMSNHELVHSCVEIYFLLLQEKQESSWLKKQCLLEIQKLCSVEYGEKSPLIQQEEDLQI